MKIGQGVVLRLVRCSVEGVIVGLNGQDLYLATETTCIRKRDPIKIPLADIKGCNTLSTTPWYQATIDVTDWRNNKMENQALVEQVSRDLREALGNARPSLKGRTRINGAALSRFKPLDSDGLALLLEKHALERRVAAKAAARRQHSTPSGDNDYWLYYGQAARHLGAADLASDLADLIRSGELVIDAAPDN